MGRGEGQRAEGEAVTPRGGHGVRQQLWETSPHSASLSAHSAADDHNTCLEPGSQGSSEQGGSRRQGCLTAPWAAAVLPGGILGLSAHTYLGLALSAGPNLGLCVGVLGLGPQGALEWLQHPPPPPHSSPELGD